MLSECDVAEARRVYVFGSKELGSPALARRYGVTTSAMMRVIRGETWKL